MFKAITAMILSAAASTAGATTLTFDPLATTVYTTSYSESGYTFTASSPSASTHIGDPFNLTSGTFGWHPGELNADPQAWTLTRDDGFAFGLVSFDFGAYDISVIDVSTVGETPLSFGSGSHSPGWLGTSMTFSFTGYNEGWIDNVVLDNDPGVVPISGTLTLAISWIAFLAFAGQRLKRRRLQNLDHDLRFKVNRNQLLREPTTSMK